MEDLFLSTLAVMPRCNLTLISPFSASGGISRARSDVKIGFESVS